MNWMSKELVSQKFDLRDDRGKELPLVEPMHRRHGLWHDRKRPWHTGLGWWVVVPMLGIGWLIYVLVLVQMNYRPGDAWVIIAAIGFGLAFRLLSAWDARRPDSRMKRFAWAPIAWLCAHRHCGACGYGLAEIEPGADGVAVCPECGAGWHRDRWSMEGRDPRQNDDLIAILEGKPMSAQASGGSGMGGVDDRGVPIAISKGWYPTWIHQDWIDIKVRRSVHDEIYAVGMRRMVVGGSILGAAWLATVVLLMWWKVPLPRDWWLDFTLVSVITGLIGLAVGYVVMRLSVNDRQIRRASLASGRCPNCGETIGGRAGFDGCVVCGRCSRAWRCEVGTVSDASDASIFARGDSKAR